MKTPIVSKQTLPETIVEKVLAASGLSECHARFVRLYMTPGQPAYANATEAYIGAGYHTTNRNCAGAASSRLRRHPRVKAVLQAIARAEWEVWDQRMLEQQRERCLHQLSFAKATPGRSCNAA